MRARDKATGTLRVTLDVTRIRSCAAVTLVARARARDRRGRRRVRPRESSGEERRRVFLSTMSVWTFVCRVLYL